MQAKGFIKTLIGALLAAALFYIGLSVMAGAVERKADAYAEQQLDRYGVTSQDSMVLMKRAFRKQFTDSVKYEKMFLGITYDYLTKNRLNLGLDLKGGMSMIVEVDQADVLRTLSYNSTDPAFNQAIEEAEAAMAEESAPFVEVFGERYEAINPGGRLASIFAPIEEYRDRLTWESTNDEVIAELSTDIESAIEETYTVLNARLDEFGVAQPNITLQEGSSRILIELPGATDDPDRVRDIVQRTAQLEFYETWEVTEAFQYMEKINDVLKKKLDMEDGAAEDTLDAAPTDDVALPVADTDVDDEVDPLAIDVDSAALDDDSSDILSLDDLDMDEAASDTALGADEFNPLYEIFAPNIRTDEQGNQFFNEGAALGFVRSRDLPQMKQWLAMDEVQSVLPRDLELMWSARGEADEQNRTEWYTLFAIRKDPAMSEAPLTGDVITNAFQSYDNLSRPAVSINMNGIGASKWADLTKRNIGQSVAIVLDNKVFSAPRVNQEIKGGSSIIEGMESIESAKDLANILKSGKLGGKVIILEEANVGPSLGQQSINNGLKALLAGLIIVVLFMVAYYSGSGVVANIALLLNLVFIIGALASLGAALTLPGMAGIVLTIGMAVDANVIIFERIREELRKDKSLRKAMEDGFDKSYSAIIDANVTTLIAGIVLYFFGLGPVKGFAIVLIIGILATLVSAVLFSRLVFDGIFSREKSVAFGTTFSQNVLSTVRFDFISKRRITYIISGAIIIGGIVSMVARGFELGVDFQGGRNYVIAFDEDVTPEEVRSTLTETFDGVSPVVKRYDVSTKVQVTTSYEIGNTDPSIDSIITRKLYAGVTPFYADPPSYQEFVSVRIESSSKVETTIADDIKKSAIWAGSLGALLIFLYLLGRFRRWQFGVGALGAVLHDILILLGLYSILHDIVPFSLEVDQKFIAALLTIIGYSINDTVVVFDRIREYLKEHPTTGFLDNVNNAIGDTLSRTLMTSLTTLLVVLVLFIFGGEAIRGFAFALLLGVFVGTYSSIFVASPIFFDTTKKSMEKA